MKLLIFLLLIPQIAYGTCNPFFERLGICKQVEEVINNTDNSIIESVNKKLPKCYQYVGDWHTIVDGKMFCADIEKDCNFIVSNCNGTKLIELKLGINNGIIELEHIRGLINMNTMILTDGKRNYIFLRMR